MTQLKKIKIAFILQNLNIGGAERVSVTLLRNLDRSKFEIILILLKREGVYLDLLPPDVEVINLNGNSTLSALPKIVWSIKKLKPDILFSTLFRLNIPILLAKILALQKIKVVLRIPTTYSLMRESSKSIRQKLELSSIFIKLLYNIADGIIFISRGSFEDFCNHFKKIDKKKCQVIYNPVEIENILKAKDEKIEEPVWSDKSRKIIAVGRLVPEKGYKYLLDAFSIVSNEIDNIGLIILGEGKERKNLEEYASKLNLTSNIIFLGSKQNPFKYMSHCDLFVLSSLWEGFANVVVEAMACGIPVVATNCPYGPGEIIDNGLNGILVPAKDPKALAQAIILILKNPELANSLGRCGFRRALDFDVKKIIKEYEELFCKIVV